LLWLSWLRFWGEAKHHASKSILTSANSTSIAVASPGAPTIGSPRALQPSGPYRRLYGQEACRRGAAGVGRLLAWRVMRGGAGGKGGLA
jgi:hypothetical protein